MQAPTRMVQAANYQELGMLFSLVGWIVTIGAVILSVAVALILLYHWRTYSAEAKGVARYELLFLSVSGLLVGMMVSFALLLTVSL